VSAITPTGFDGSTMLCAFVKFQNGGSGVSLHNVASAEEAVTLALKPHLGGATGANHRDKIVHGVVQLVELAFGQSATVESGEHYFFTATEIDLPRQCWAGPTVEATANVEVAR